MTSHWLRKKISLLIAIIVGILIAFLITQKDQTLKRDENRNTQKLAEYIVAKTIPVKGRAIGYGEVSPEKTLDGNAQVEGRIIYISHELKKGASVKQGAVLVKIDPSDYQLSLAKAEANLAIYQAERDKLITDKKNTQSLFTIAEQNYTLGLKALERKRKLLKQKSISQSLVEEEEQALLKLQESKQILENSLKTLPAQIKVTEAQIIQAQQDIEQQQNNLMRTVITSPFDARISQVYIEQDQFISRGSKLFTANNIGRVEINAELPVSHARVLLTGIEKIKFSNGIPSTQEVLKKLGLEAKVKLVGAFKDTHWQGKAVRLGESINQTSRTVSIIVGVDDSYQKVIPGKRPPLLKGMYTEVEFTAPARERLVIPRAVIHQNKVYTVGKNNHLIIKEVTVAYNIGELAVVEQGLVDGEKIITTDLIPAVEGMALQPELNTAQEKTILALANAEAAFK
ncbi:efflux RND transporter periplasmic adaptor subunit [Zooshikella harenae]|uniref:Biotin/lipoyl-binding protein n=1 Tax=Zooshikella harenae TaxID=2827238 RepID=A0ABS5ZD44_9GAMM|nr:HlyD family efflux transporter periplasmic adaptor subunit [Zooshikella harenae]MBU2711899.1 biotin/lipoyl-binding protein [Zooshikella harenae]